MTLSVAIMHVPSSPERAANVLELLAAFPSATVIEERGLGAWDTARRAWGCASGDQHLVLQDDAGLAPTFAELAAAAAAAAAGPVAFCRAPAHYRDIPSAVAMCMPTAMARRWLAWCERRPPDQLRHDNVLLWSWAMRHGVAIATDPRELVTHLPFPSLLGHDPP